MNQKKVFIVEDDLDIQEVISLVLASSGYDINTCRTANDLHLEMIRHLPDLIVLDVRLPDGNGIDICKEVRDGPQTSHIPILLMSANQYEKADIGCANAFIGKPFDIDVFRNKIEELLFN